MNENFNCGAQSPLSTVGTDQPDNNFIVLVIPNPDIRQQMLSVAPFITFDPQGTAQIPCMSKNDFIEYFEGMGYTNEDYQFREAYDLNNGYGDEKYADKLGKHGDRWFPDSETTTPPRKVGPSAAKYANNPMFSGMKESNDPILKSLTENYLKYKKSKHK